MHRRHFLKSTATGFALPAIFGGVSLRAIAASPFLQALAGDLDSGRVLVLIQLTGGNDGLNTVIPLDHYDSYVKARNNIAIPQAKILSLTGYDHTGLNPALKEMQGLFNDGKMSIVQSVSYPQPNFSHFRATDIWLTGADSNQVLPTGWAGRYLNMEYPKFPQNYPNTQMPDPLAVQVGSIVSPALQGPGLTMGMAISNPSSFYNLVNGQPVTDTQGRSGDLLAYIRQMSLKTDQYAGVIKTAAQKVTKQSALYPAQGKNPLADQLKIVARMIGGGLKTKIYMVSMGSFDTHARQTDATDTTTGNHAKLLGQLSVAVSAFMDDLEGLQVSDRVIGMTFSEFGRRIKSNASGGTDHGAGAPVFLFGKNVQGGILGNSPDLPNSATPNDNIPMQYDFRSLYATLLEKWFGVGPDQLHGLLLKDYQSLPLVAVAGRGGGKNGTQPGERPKADSSAAPGAGGQMGATNGQGHPVGAAPGAGQAVSLKPYSTFFSGSTDLAFTTAGGHTMVQVFDTEGQLVDIPYCQEASPGKHTVRFQADQLPEGIYYARVENGIHQQVVRMEKVRG